MAFQLKDMWFPALCVAIIGAWILVHSVKIRWITACLIASVKAAIPILYFSLFFNRQWMLLDDQTYFEKGRLMLWEGNNPFLIFFTPDGLNRLLATAGGTHFLYYWWNLLAMYFFGPFYSSPIFLNVLTTFVSAAVLYKIAQMSGFIERYSRLLAIFLLFHWDVLIWSSLINLKDTLIMMLTLISISCGLRFIQTRRLVYVAVLVATMFVFLWIRLYIPVLLLGSFGMWLALSFKGWKRVSWVLLATFCIWLVFPEGAIQTFRDVYVADWIFGPLRMALTPQPWSITTEYSFLVIPSIFHWALFIPASIVGFRLAMKNQIYRLVAIYFVVMMVFYGLIPQQQTSRERMQVSWILAWAQFDVLWAVGTAAIQKLSASKKTVAQFRKGQLVNQKI